MYSATLTYFILFTFKGVKYCSKLVEVLFLVIFYVNLQMERLKIDLTVSLNEIIVGNIFVIEI